MFPEGRLLDFLIVGAVALIVVGPKDLPILMRKVGQFLARMRGMAAEFRASFDELARQSELDELRKEVEALRNARPLDAVAEHADPDKVLADIHAGLAETGAQLHPAGAYQPSAADPPPAQTAPPVAAPEPPTAAKPKRVRKAAAKPAESVPTARKTRARSKNAGAAS
ncbi:MAG: Sec-independent protein translocase protein TatB [Caulobacterales bacterium]